jgi:hypothetical protein
MSAADFIERMRDKQAELYSNTVTVTRKSAAGAFNAATASYATPTTTTVYTGAALLRPERDQTADVGEVSLNVSNYLLKLPVNTAAEIGDNVAVTASDFDDDLVGTTLRIIEVSADEWQIARRCRCVVETARPT